MRVLSLGAGVQSSTLLLMADRGHIQADRAIFADTGWEPKAVYDYLDYLRETVSIPIDVVSNGNLRDDLMAAGDGKRFGSIPVHLYMEKGNKWSAGMARRQCTSEYKLVPIRRRLVELGATRKNPITVLIGISTDEVRRAKPSDRKYAINEHPLIEMGMSRLDCLVWLKENVPNWRTPPKSACIGCPYHDKHGWQMIQLNPEEWADAIEIDEAIRKMPRFRGQAFLHRSLKPLAEVDLTDADPGPTLFDLECEGICGV